MVRSSLSRTPRRRPPHRVASAPSQGIFFAAAITASLVFAGPAAHAQSVNPTPDGVRPTVHYSKADVGGGREGTIGRIGAPRVIIPTSGSLGAPSEADAIRFLEQASFGPTPAEVLRVRQMGIPAWIDDQFTRPVSNYNYLLNLTFSSQPAQARFFQNAIGKPGVTNDQLRQRVAFTFSQFVVVGARDGAFPSEYYNNAARSYQEVMLNGAFSNYRQFMSDFTLNPAMGAYLNMVNNVKPNAATNSLPNENYSRELLQLFTLGVWQLNQDGSVKRDAGNNLIPTYDNDDVKEFARVFTGWVYAPKFGQPLNSSNAQNLSYPMALYAANHDTGSKVLFARTLPVNSGTQTPVKDLNDALDDIFAHQNLAPFVVTRLIQHHVTANPSPQYVADIVAIFNNNGQGVKGDMKAVIKAMLIHKEARGYDPQTGADIALPTGQGHYKEPILWMTNLFRQLGATGDFFGFGAETSAAALGQEPLNPRSVFSYYKPEYAIQVNGQAYSAPEVQLLTTDSAVRRLNLLDTFLYGSISSGTPKATSVTLNYTPWTTGGANALAAPGKTTLLLNDLDARMLHGTMPAVMRTEITKVLDGASGGGTGAAITDPTLRVKAAIYLVAGSTQYNYFQ